MSEQNDPTGTFPIAGLHHITVMAGDPQRNLNFYAHILGQRLIKTTVNFDDPGTYHLYYADRIGMPGTVLTFFPWPNARRGRLGTGEVGAMAYTIPLNSLDYWRDRLTQFEVSQGQEQERFGSPVLTLQDPDGLRLELIAKPDSPAIDHWEDGPVPQEHALRGFHSVTQNVAELEPSAKLLTDVFGFSAHGSEGSRHRFLATDSAESPGRVIDLMHMPGEPRGNLGAGSVHHIAFRVAHDEAQLAWRERLIDAQMRVTDVQDRQYFHSIYFREPGGTLYEFATDQPGFLIDESPEELGQALRLPPWYEPHRAEIQQALPPLER